VALAGAVDAVWTGSPQWQIEGLRRLEIPEDMQKKHGFAPPGAADGPAKTAIFGGNNARLCGIEPKRAQLELRQEGRLRQGRPNADAHALRLRASERGAIPARGVCLKRGSAR